MPSRPWVMKDAFVCFTTYHLRFKDWTPQHLHLKIEKENVKYFARFFRSGRFHCGDERRCLSIMCYIAEYCFYRSIAVGLCLQFHGFWWLHIRITVGGYVVAYSHPFHDWMDTFHVLLSRYLHICCTDRLCLWTPPEFGLQSSALFYLRGQSNFVIFKFVIQHNINMKPVRALQRRVTVVSLTSSVKLLQKICKNT
jgi:hypothetical protein